MSTEALLILEDGPIIGGRIVDVGATFRSPAGGLKASPTSLGSDVVWGWLDGR